MGRAGFVVLAGRPNTGKSTLLNRVVGTSLAAVSPKAQMTRERLHGILTEKNGQIVFVDTPGIHRAREGGLNQAMMEEARTALEATEVVWYLVDAPVADEKHELPVWEELKRAAPAPVFLLLNKADRLSKEPARLEQLEEKLRAALKTHGIEVAECFRISALKGKGVPELMTATWKLLPEGPAYYPDEEQVSDRPMRYFVGEKIREQLYAQLGDELPYSCAVQITKFDENRTIPHIEASLFVERDSQKGMVVGKGGSKIKSIGQEARKSIEAFLGGKVFLGLKVEVLKDWSRDAKQLEKLGYILPKTKAAR